MESENLAEGKPGGYPRRAKKRGWERMKASSCPVFSEERKYRDGLCTPFFLSRANEIH